MTADTASSNAVCDFGVTLRTGPLGDGPISSCYLNVVFEVTGSEGIRMEEAVYGLGPILRYQPRRSVTVIANSDVAMTRLHPARPLFFHNVTIRACGRVVGQIGTATSIAEREQGNATKGTNQNGHHGEASAHLSIVRWLRSC